MLACHGKQSCTKRENYRRAFHDFDIDTCAKMSDDELEQLLSNSGLIRNRNKIF